ncbi:MAG: cytochrome c oxidase assembly protein [Oleiphilaceae bacterium]|nr:cytochrome c oxidase assembly protein [Oleiphilaceae bacterium]
MSTEVKHRRTVLKSLFAVMAMFAFGFAMVPLYDVFCDITGLNGKTGGRYEMADKPMEVDESRQVRVQFTTSNNEEMPWEFRPLVHEMKVHPGEMVKVDFYARNPTNQKMIAQAVPSLSPSRGTDYFHKTECFCFNQQELGPKEDINMPLIFVVDTALPEDVPVLTLSYTLFDQTAMLKGSAKLDTDDSQAAVLAAR